MCGSVPLARCGKITPLPCHAEHAASAGDTHSATTMTPLKSAVLYHDTGFITIGNHATLRGFKMIPTVFLQTGWPLDMAMSLDDTHLQHEKRQGSRRRNQWNGLGKGTRRGRRPERRHP